MKVHLVDGTFELFRAHFGSPAATAPDGREVGAVRGLLRSLLGLLTEPGVTHVGVAFDSTVESFRNELFAGYKTGEGIEPDLLGQFPLAESATRALGLVVWPMVEFEADDALATAAARFAGEAAVTQVVLCSPDKDLAQCIRGRRVVGIDRIRRKTLDEDGVRAKFGVGPASMADWLGLVGDAADGLPGVPRWGAKSSSAVLAEYGRIEAIPASAADWRVDVRGAAALAASLQAHLEEALLYRRLATLRTDVPITEELEGLRWRGPDPGALAAVAELIGDSQIERRALQIAGKRA